MAGAPGLGLPPNAPARRLPECSNRQFEWSETGLTPASAMTPSATKISAP
jgi:predicted cobalt transporter CbtA